MVKPWASLKSRNLVPDILLFLFPFQPFSLHPSLLVPFALSLVPFFIGFIGLDFDYWFS